METVIKDAKDGDNIVSSIDMNIQRIVQKSIKKYMKKYSPKRISVVIANPNNGEILAMADDTTFASLITVSILLSELKAAITAFFRGQMEESTVIWIPIIIWKQ